MLQHVQEFHSFLGLNKIPLHIYIHSPIDGHLSCFHLLLLHLGNFLDFSEPRFSQYLEKKEWTGFKTLLKLSIDSIR